MCLVFRQNRFGDFELTREARLAPGAIKLMYIDKNTVQVYSKEEYNWAKQSVCAASIDKNAPAYSIMPPVLPTTSELI